MDDIEIEEIIFDIKKLTNKDIEKDDPLLILFEANRKSFIKYKIELTQNIKDQNDLMNNLILTSNRIINDLDARTNNLKTIKNEFLSDFVEVHKNTKHQISILSLEESLEKYYRKNLTKDQNLNKKLNIFIAILAINLMLILIMTIFIIVKFKQFY
jgi:hypothetical protein